MYEYGKTTSEWKPEIDLSHLNELLGDSPRAAAIAGMAFIEDELRELLKARLVYDKALFTRIKILGVDNLIKWCFVLGLINRVDKNALEKLNSVRNDFAHLKESITFDSEKINKKCREMSEFFAQSLRDIKWPVILRPGAPSSKQFSTAINHYIMILRHMRKKCRRIRLGEAYISQ